MLILIPFDSQCAYANVSCFYLPNVYMSLLLFIIHFLTLFLSKMNTGTNYELEFVLLNAFLFENSTNRKRIEMLSTFYPFHR